MMFGCPPPLMAFLFKNLLPLRLCVRNAFLLALLLMASLAACTSGPPPAKSGPLVMIRESVAHKPRDTAQPAAPEDAQEKKQKAPEKKGGAFTLLQPLKFTGAKKGSGSVETVSISNEKMVSVAVNEMPLPDFIHYPLAYNPFWNFSLVNIR